METAQCIIENVIFSKFSLSNCVCFLLIRLSIL